MIDDFKSRYLNKDDVDVTKYRCLKCGRKVMEVGNPFASMFYTACPTATPDSERHYVLCSEHTLALGEWLCPQLLDDPAYLAKKDQYDASVEDWKGRTGQVGE